MAGPIILRDLTDRQLELLESSGTLAFIPRFRLGDGDVLMIWWESRARWVYALVDKVVVDAGISDYEEYVRYSGYGSVEEWLSAEEKRLGGVLPRRLALLRLVEYGSWEEKQ
ncbi:MAG: hypothetical protein F7C35_08380 [Desulfurococcales archaeon]|nr:hypothetical protein [Desulfurococcales archaeon]